MRRPLGLPFIKLVEMSYNLQSRTEYGFWIARRSIRELRSLPPDPTMRTTRNPALAPQPEIAHIDGLDERVGPAR